VEVRIQQRKMHSQIYIFESLAQKPLIRKRIAAVAKQQASVTVTQ
jgi:hypothetical protein